MQVDILELIKELEKQVAKGQTIVQIHGTILVPDNGNFIIYSNDKQI